MSRILPLFPTPVYVSHIESLSKEDVDRTKSLEYTEIVTGKGYISKETKVLDLFAFLKLKKEILIHFEKYLDMMGVDKSFLLPEITNSWAIKHLAGDYAKEHRHANSMFSGIVYIQCDELSGELVMHNRNDNLFTGTLHPKFLKVNEFNSNTAVLEPTPSTIFIFPSHLHHSVQESKSQNERYCIAFNFFLKGRYGEYIDRVDLN